MEHSPTVRGRRLIREIGRLRHGSGLSMEAAAHRLGWSTSKLYRLENGRSRITTDDLADMLDLYGIRSPPREALIQLGRDARRRGWWTAYSDVFTGSYIAMEAEAASVRVNAHLVPGIFQTPGYAHEIIRRTRSAISAGDAERRVAARAARQDALFSRDDRPEIHVILDEAVLHRQVGGPAVACQQLTALAETATWPNVTVQVLPFTAGANAVARLRGGGPVTVTVTDPAPPGGDPRHGSGITVRPAQTCRGSCRTRSRRECRFSWQLSRTPAVTSASFGVLSESSDGPSHQPVLFLCLAGPGGGALSSQ